MRTTLRIAIREMLQSGGTLAEGRSLGKMPTSGHLGKVSEFLDTYKNKIVNSMAWDTGARPAFGSDSISDLIECFKRAAEIDRDSRGSGSAVATCTLILICDDAEPLSVLTPFSLVLGGLASSLVEYMPESHHSRRLLREGYAAKLVVNLVEQDINRAISRALDNLTLEAISAEIAPLVRKLAEENFDNDLSRAAITLQAANRDKPWARALTLNGQTIGRDVAVEIAEEVEKKIGVNLTESLAADIMGDGTKKQVSLYDFKRAISRKVGPGTSGTNIAARIQSQVIDKINAKIYDNVLNNDAGITDTVKRYAQGTGPVTRALTAPGREAARRGYDTAARLMSMGDTSASIPGWDRIVNPGIRGFVSHIRANYRDIARGLAKRLPAPAAGAAFYAGASAVPSAFLSPSAEDDFSEYQTATSDIERNFYYSPVEAIGLARDVADLVDSSEVRSAAGALASKLDMYTMVFAGGDRDDLSKKKNNLSDALKGISRTSGDISSYINKIANL